MCVRSTLKATESIAHLFFLSKTRERKKQTENGVHGQAELTLTEMRGLALALERQTSASYIPK
jgi:hypothetical protein